MLDASMVTRACVAAAMVACMAMPVEAWGSYPCSLTPVDKEQLANATLKSAQQVKASFTSLEEKVDRILEVLTPSAPLQPPWLSPPHLYAGTVEREVRRERSESEELSRDERDDMRRGEDVTGKDQHNKEVERPRNTTKESRRDRNEETEDTTADSVLEAKEGRENEEEDNAEPKKGQCSVMVTDNHATIGLFYMSTYNHGHCANRYPITTPIRYCLGYCPTRTFVIRKEGIWGQGHDCKSCQPSRLETVRIPLVCDDGFSFEKNFKNVVDCVCTKCRPLEG